MLIIILASAMTVSMMIATFVMLHNESVHVRAQEKRRVAHPFGTNARTYRHDW